MPFGTEKERLAGVAWRVHFDDEMCLQPRIFFSSRGNERFLGKQSVITSAYEFFSRSSSFFYTQLDQQAICHWEKRRVFYILRVISHVSLMFPRWVFLHKSFFFLLAIPHLLIFYSAEASVFLQRCPRRTINYISAAFLDRLCSNPVVWQHPSFRNSKS